MPRTKSLGHYPSRYLEIIRECAVEGKTTTLRLADIKRALSLRGHWYAFIGSLKAEAARIRREARGLPGTGDADILELAAQSPSVMVQLERQDDGSCIVIWQSREHSWQAKALATATTISVESQPTAKGISDIAARLMKVQQETEDDNNS